MDLQQIQSALPPGPKGATSASEGPDGQLHWFDIQGRDLGIVPGDGNEDSSPTATVSNGPNRQPDIFDQLASQNAVQQTTSKSSVSGANRNDIFDQLAQGSHPNESYGTPAEQQAAIERHNRSAAGAVASGLNYGGDKVAPPNASFTERANTAADNFMSDFGEGVVRGGGDTAEGALSLYRKTGLPVPRFLSNEKGTGLLDAQDTEARNAGETTGKFAETLLEFMAGDELLKSASLATKLGAAQKVAKLAETSPRVAKALEIGMNSLRLGSVGAAQDLEKTGGSNPVGSLETGAGVAAGSAALEGVVAPAVKKVIGKLIDVATPEQLNALGQLGVKTPIEAKVNQAVDKSSLQFGKAKASAAEIENLTKAGQTNIENTLRDIVGRRSYQDNFPEISSDSLRDIGKDLGDQYYSRSKAAFAQIDEATGGRFSRFSDAMKRIDEKIAEVADINPEKELALVDQKNLIQGSMDKVFQDAKAKGIDPQIADQAKLDWKKFNAAYDFGNQVRMSTTGRGANESVDLDKLTARMNKMFDSNSPTQPGRLQQLFGEKPAQQFLDELQDHQQNNVLFKDFASRPSTGKQAMKELLAPSTRVGARFLNPTTQINFRQALDNFEKLGTKEQIARFGDQVGTARQFLRTGRNWQVAGNVGKAATIGAFVHWLGLDKSVLHLLLD